MTTKPCKVYQFKITLKRIRPPIWRRIQVPGEYTFWELHVALQDAMGWLDYHLHEFTIPNPQTGKVFRIGIPDPAGDIGWGEQLLAGWETPIKDYFTEGNPKATYTYDFGDNWDHDVVLESILVAASNEYPVCIAGRRACPPEDCGGPWGYEELLEALGDEDHARHQKLMEWLGGDFDPDHFNAEEVEFENPEERRQFFLDSTDAN